MLEISILEVLNWPRPCGKITMPHELWSKLLKFPKILCGGLYRGLL